MNLVLIQPPVEDFYSTDIRLQPIGLAYLKAALKQYFPEVNVIIRDYHWGFPKRSIPRPKELAFLKDYYRFPDRSPFSTFYHYYHFGADLDTIVQDVARFNPDLVAVSALFTAYAPQALKVAECIKKQLNVSVLMGGSHVSAMPRQTLAEPFVDFVIQGEGEKPIVAFVDEWLGKRRWHKVPNLGFKGANSRLTLNKIEPNFPIDAIPFPDLSDFAPHDYRFGDSNLSFIISSRSCPYRCAFCSVHQTFGRSFRLRSVENIVQELHVRHEQGYRVFDFEDDNLTFDLKRIQNLNATLRHEFADKDLRFMAMNGIAYFRLTEDILQGMHLAGFRDLNISLVSINQPLMRGLKRPLNLKAFTAVVQKAYELNMHVVSYQILGLPGDSVASMIETLAFQTRLPVTIGVSPFYLTPGMPLAQSVTVPRPQWLTGRLTSLGATADDGLRSAIYTLFILARMVNFLKALPLADSHVSLNDLIANRKYRKGRQRLGLDILQLLLKEKRLYAATGKDFKPLPKFRYEIFETFVKQAKFIQRPDGGRIEMETIA